MISLYLHIIDNVWMWVDQVGSDAVPQSDRADKEDDEKLRDVEQRHVNT